MKNKHNAFIFLAVIGLVAAIALVLTGLGRHETTPADQAQTRASVEASLTRLLPASVSSAADPALTSAIQQLVKENYVSTVWLVDSSGKIIVHEGGNGQVGLNVHDWFVDNPAQPYVDGLVSDALSADQTLQLLTLGAIRSEGEHNDVFNHLVFPVTDQNGQIQALVAIAYDKSPQVGAPGTVYIVSLFAFLAGLSLYWLGLPLWVYFDARQRGESAPLWGIFVLITNLVGLIAYLIVIKRPAR